MGGRRSGWSGSGSPPPGTTARLPTGEATPVATPARRSSSRGIDDCQDLIGDHPSLVQEHGAAGYELDRADSALGTPGARSCSMGSTGSIAWCGALAHNGYDNDISRITDNVLRAFASGGPLSRSENDAIGGGGRPE
jgi:N,N-dimethylformamidase